MTVARVREVLFPFLLIILASFLTITAYYYRAQDRCDFFLFHFKSIKLGYCNKGPPVKVANKDIFNIPEIKSQFIVKTLRF